MAGLARFIAAEEELPVQRAATQRHGQGAEADAPFELFHRRLAGDIIERRVLRTIYPT